MELKKSIEANNEKQKGSIRLMGFLFVSSLILASFSYVTPLKQDDDSDAQSSANKDVVEQVFDEPEEPEPEVIETTVEVQAATPQEDTPEKENEATPPKPTPPTPPPAPPAPKPKVEEKVIEFPDKEASFVGGYNAMSAFIKNNIQYPEISMDMGEQGRVYVSFVVDKNGNISDVKIEKGVSELLDREAKRIVRSMPSWDAGEKDGEKVKTKVSLPIVFKIN